MPLQAATAATLLDWAARRDADAPRLLRLVGSRGSGKSLLLAELLDRSESVPGARIHATVPAQSQTAETFAWELGRQLGYGPLPPEELTARVAADPRPVRILVPDLHLAGVGLPGGGQDTHPADIAERVLTPLLALPLVRMAVETGVTGLLAGLPGLDLAPAPGRTPLPGAAPVSAPASAPASGIGTGIGTPAAGSDWSTVAGADRDRALAAGAADRARLLADPGYLVHGSPVAVTAALADPRTRAPGRLRRAWAAAAPAVTTYGLDPVERAALLHAAALTADPALAEYLRPLAATHTWHARWSRRVSGVRCLAPTGRGLALADDLGRVQLVDPGTGAPAGVVPTEPSIHPDACAAAGDRLLFADDGALHLSLVGTDTPPTPNPTAPATAPSEDLAAATARHNRRALAEPGARPTALGSGPGTPVAVGTQDGHVHLWPLGDPAEQAATGYRPHELPVTAVAVLRPAEGPLLVLTGALDGTVRLWDARTRTVMPVPVEQRAALPLALAATDTPDGPLLAVAWSDQRIHLWQLLSGSLCALPWPGVVEALAFAPDGTLLAATGTTLTAIAVRPYRHRPHGL